MFHIGCANHAFQNTRENNLQTVFSIKCTFKNRSNVQKYFAADLILSTAVLTVVYCYLITALKVVNYSSFKFKLLPSLLVYVVHCVTNVCCSVHNVAFTYCCGCFAGEFSSLCQPCIHSFMYQFLPLFVPFLLLPVVPRRKHQIFLRRFCQFQVGPLSSYLGQLSLPSLRGR